MKYLLAIGSVIALFSVATVPAQAALCPSVSSHTASTSPTPHDCALPDTKTKHPDWYRDGGYCNGGTTVTQEVTGNSHFVCDFV